MTKTRDTALNLLLGFWEQPKKKKEEMHEMYVCACGPVLVCVHVNANQDVGYV